MKTYITWSEVDRLVGVIASQIAVVPPSIYGIPRGGLIPAVMLSHRLGVPLVGKPKPDSLIVDEIADSGNTLKQFDQKSAVLIWKKCSIVMPSFFGELTESSSWIVFPWEIDT